jgi:hypothetical protein
MALILGFPAAWLTTALDERRYKNRPVSTHCRLSRM